MKQLTVILFLLLFQLSFAQKAIELSDELKEISGLQYVNDTLLIAHNDGGNSPTLFLLNAEGKIIKRVGVMNVKNTDWEDITFNGHFVFIGDIGNNSNKRKKLNIYRIPWTDVLTKDSVEAKKMSISYAEQTAFPPEKKNMNFDAECLIYSEGNLWIFTKNRTEPFDGISTVYRFKFQENSDVVLKQEFTIKIGTKGWMQDAITGGDFAFGYFYLTSYNRVLKYSFDGDKFNLVKEFKYNDYNQKEAITVITDDLIYVANENYKWLGKQKLYKISLKK